MQELAERRDLPTGTVTFLRTDVEGSMVLARTVGAGWDALNATHIGLIRGAIDAHGGVLVRTEGDAIFAVFTDAGAAVAAAIDAQRLIGDHAWPQEAAIRVRMALHTGEAHRAGDDYGGFEVNRAARIAGAGHGGQIVLSEATRALAVDALPDGVLVRDLGLHALKDVPRPERLFQLDVPGPAHGVPTPAHGGDRHGRRPGAADELRRPASGARRAARAPGRSPPADARPGPAASARPDWPSSSPGRASTAAADGTWFVALDEIEEPALVRSAIARTMGLFDGPERSAADALLPYLADRSALLVLDNLEHLMGATSDVTAILRGSPGTRVVVTSRSPLRISGEQEYPVRPLEASASGVHDSVALFVERAQRVRPGFDPGPEAATIAEICELLDGLPLGIELAAARTSLLPLPRSATDWGRGCRFRAPGSAMCPIDNGRWKARSAGAMPCCRRSDSGCCARSRSSMAGSISSRSTPSRAARTCSMGSWSSSTRAS